MILEVFADARHVTDRVDPQSLQALAIPDTEARRIGLTAQSWIIVDEWNLDDVAAQFAQRQGQRACLLLRARDEHSAAYKRLLCLTTLSNGYCQDRGPSTALGRCCDLSSLT